MLIIKNIIWFIFFLILFIDFTGQLTSRFFFIAGILVLFLVFSKKNKMNYYSLLLLFLPIGSYIFWLVLGIKKVDFTPTIARQTMFLFFYAFIIKISIRSYNDILSFLKMGIVFSLMNILMSIISILTGNYFNSGNIDSISGFERACGWTSNPNTFSAILVTSLIFLWIRLQLFDLISPKTSINYKYILKILILITIGMLFTTLSRNGIVALFVFLATWYYFELKGHHKLDKKKKILTISIFVVLVGYLIYSNFYLIAQGVFERDLTFTNNRIENGRILFWTAHYRALQQWTFYNFIAGIGYNQIGVNLETGLGLVLSNAQWKLISSVENGFIWIFLGSGLWGLVILILLFISSIRNSKILIKSKNMLHKKLGILLLSSTFALIVQASLMDFMYLGVVMYYYILLGLPSSILQFENTYAK